MNPRDSGTPDGEASLNCPKCGAPASLPEDPGTLMVTCHYCDEAFPIPRPLREAQERRLFFLRGRTERSSTPGIIAIIAVLVVVGALASVLVALRTAHVAAKPTSNQPDPSPQAIATDSVPSIPPIPSVDESVASGESRVKELLQTHESAGCVTLLLPPTRIEGGRDIDAKLVGNGPCVRLVASSGTSGEALELTMHTPSGKPVSTPAASPEIDFLYCPKHAGMHPATIRSNGEHLFTVSSVECPRR